jgi:hypothetical protein
MLEREPLLLERTTHRKQHFGHQDYQNILLRAKIYGEGHNTTAKVIMLFILLRSLFFLENPTNDTFVSAYPVLISDISLLTLSSTAPICKCLSLEEHYHC